MEEVLAYIDKGAKGKRPILDFDVNTVDDIILRFKIKYLFNLPCDEEFETLSQIGELFPILEKYTYLSRLNLKKKITITNFEGLHSIKIYMKLFLIININDEFVKAYENVHDPKGNLTIYLFGHREDWERFYPMLKLVIPEQDKFEINYADWIKHYANEMSNMDYPSFENDHISFDNEEKDFWCNGRTDNEKMVQILSDFAKKVVPTTEIIFAMINCIDLLPLSDQIYWMNLVKNEDYFIDCESELALEMGFDKFPNMEYIDFNGTSVVFLKKYLKIHPEQQYEVVYHVMNECPEYLHEICGEVTLNDLNELVMAKID